ncbi:MAG: hypothetical protein K6T59_18075 [Bryobacteraceae bacterium]|nr:hypothetical protein [Bryobacteraceae bacterium]
MFVGINFSSWKTWAVVATVLAATSVGIERTWSYLKTGHSLLGKKIEGAVPLDFEIARLGQMIKEASMALRKDEQQLALMEVECEQLAEEIKNRQKELEQAERDMFRLREALNGSGPQVEIGGKTYSRQEVEGELERRLDEYDFRKQALTDREKSLAERQGYVAAARKQLEQNYREVQKLELTQQSLADQKRLLDSQNTPGSPQFDPSKVAQASQLAQELVAKMRAEQKVREKFLTSHRIELPREEGSVTERFDKQFGKQTVKTPAAGESTPVAAASNDSQ